MSADPTPTSSSPPPRRSIVAPLALGLALVALAAVAIHRSLQHEIDAPSADGRTPRDPQGGKLCDYWEIGDFSLVDQYDKPFTKASLGRKIWIFDFFYTSCSAQCIELTSKVKSLAAAYQTQPDVEIASVTVDPENDTPGALVRYAQANGAGSLRWHFLTGTKEQVEALRSQLFKDSKGSKELHSTRLYVVDRDAHVRGIHDTQLDDEWKPAVLHTVNLLLEQRKK